MPTYTYKCRGCESVFDVFQRITAEPGAVCAECGGEDCRRQITGGAFHLKGSGWYASDYNGKKSAPKPEPAGDCTGEGPAAGCQGPCATDSADATQSAEVATA